MRINNNLLINNDDLIVRIINIIITIGIVTPTSDDDAVTHFRNVARPSFIQLRLRVLRSGCVNRIRKK